MRKILLGTTAVVGAALLGATAAQAQTAPTVRVGGFMVTMFNYVNDDLDKAAGPGSLTGVAGAGTVSRDKTDFRNELEVQVFVTGKAANGMAYGAVIEFQNDNSGASGAGTAVDIDEAYVFVSSPTLGTIRFGEEDSAASLLQVRHPQITGLGSDGDWDDGVLGSQARTGGGPSLLTGINDGNDSTKIVYLSPQFFGFDFGASFSPNAGEGERITYGRVFDTFSTTAASPAVPLNNLQRDGTSLSNEFSGAIRYRGSFGNVGIAAGFGAMRADAPSASAGGAAISGRDITAYTAGLNVSAFGFTVGGEYTWGNYSGVSAGRGALAQGRDGSDLYVLGATYVTGALSFGGWYGVATQDNGTGVQDREQTSFGVGAAYTIAPGLEIFGSYNKLEDKNVNISAQLRDRNVDVFFLGTRLAF